MIYFSQDIGKLWIQSVLKAIYILLQYWYRFLQHVIFVFDECERERELQKFKWEIIMGHDGLQPLICIIQINGYNYSQHVYLFTAIGVGSNSGVV